MNPAAFLHRQLAYFVGTPADRRIHLFRTPTPSSPMFLHERARIILRRTEVLAWTFMVLVALWIAVDVMVFPPEIANALVLGRVTAVLGLGALLVLSLLLVQRARWLTSYLTLLGLLAVPALFALYAQPVFNHWVRDGGTFTPTQAAAISLYRQLPIIYIAGLALFPMTMFESVPLMALVLAMMVAADLGGSSGGAIRVDQWADLWVVLVTGGSAALAGVLQFNLLWQNHRLMDYDADTGMMKRQAGLDLLQLYWHDRGRSARMLAVGVIMLPRDSAKTNDGADRDRSALSELARALHEPLPRGLQAVRWSTHGLGLVGIDSDPATMTRVMDAWIARAQAHAAPGAPLRHAVRDRSSAGVGPLTLLESAESAAQRQR